MGSIRNDKSKRNISSRSNFLTILLDAKKNLLSFVFVREPFERLISSYYDKMDRDWSKPQYDLRWMRDEIIKKLVTGVKKRNWPHLK